MPFPIEEKSTCSNLHINKHRSFWFTVTASHEAFNHIIDTEWLLVSSHLMHRPVDCDAERVEGLIRVSSVHRSLLRWIGSTENGDARWTSQQGCSLPKGVGGTAPCCKAVTKQLDGAVIGYTDPSVVMQSGANMRSRFKEFIDSRRWIGFIRKSSLVNFAKAMTLFYRGVMLLLLTSL